VLAELASSAGQWPGTLAGWTSPGVALWVECEWR
jgi:hypothetical protein